MSQILTIDWDYFFHASLEVRDKYFPDITDGSLKSKPDNSKWLDIECPKFSVDWDNVQLLISVLSNVIPKVDISFISENHGEMYNVVKYIKEKVGDKDPLCITNIDFHHDYYYTNGNIPCCDNWLRLVKEQYPDTICKWCKRPDSVLSSFGDNVCETVPIYEDFLDCIMHNIESGVYKYIHLCRSDLYSPPLIDMSFEKVKEMLSKSSKSTKYIGTIPDRRVVSFKFMKKYLKENTIK